MTITADTNVLVYLHDEDEPMKRQVARQVVGRLLELEAVIGLQVVGEFYNALSRKLRIPSWIAARESRNLLESFETFEYSRSTVDRAIERAAAGRNSYWDALLLAAAEEAGIRVFLSEDMSDGEMIFGVKIINPFTEGPAPSGAALDALGL